MQTFIINTELSDGVSSDERTVSGSSGEVLGGVGPQDAGREGKGSGGAAGTSAEPDPVNNPSHYQSGGIEAIDAIDAIVDGLGGREAHYAGCVVKYIFRASKKGNKLQDYKKSRWYLDRLICYIEGNAHHNS